MQHILKSSRLAVSCFPGGNLVVTGKNKSFVTLQSNQEDVQKFLFENGVPLSQMREALENAVTLDWSTKLLPPTEHKTDAGDHLFTDRGNRVTFDRDDVPDDEIRLALVHAENKFGKQLTLTGDDQIFAGRMARLADDMGLTILNPELQTVITEHRAAMASNAPSVAPPRTRAVKTKKLWWPFSWPSFH